MGASHQTGWTGLVGRLIQANGIATKEMLESPNIESEMFKALSGMESADSVRARGA